MKVLNWFDLEWKEWTEGPALYRTRYAPLAGPLGARKLGYHAHILPPRTALCPYHAHFVNEELFVVLGGEPSVRLGGHEHRLAAGDVVNVPPGPHGAHQLLNPSDRPAHLLAASTMIEREVVDYPDSGKRLFGVEGMVVDPAADDASSGGNGSRGAETRARVLVRDGQVVDYFDGEPAFDPFMSERSRETSPRDPRIVRMGDVSWETHALGPFGGERKRLSESSGARLLGYSLYRLQPGQRPWPFHFHHVNEEFFYVRGGYGRLRTREGTHDLRPGDAFACPPGPEGAHAILNTGDRPLEYLALSTMEEPEVAEYPDSGKIGVMVGSPPGGEPARRTRAFVFRTEDAVDYLEGET